MAKRRTFLLIIQAQPDVRPVIIRVRNDLKAMLRRLKLRCRKIVPIDPAEIPVVVSRSTRRRPRQRALPFSKAAAEEAGVLHHQILRLLAAGELVDEGLRGRLKELAERERG